MNKISVINIKCDKDIQPYVFEKSISKVLEEGNFILGNEVKAFEKTIQDYLNVKHAIGVANGTDALVIAMDALGIGPGDEVITTPYTFFASAETICRVGAKPVFVDVLEDTYNIDPKLIEVAITEKTKAILPVHIFGNPVDCKSLKAIAKKYNLYIIEDACQAIGATYEGEMIGGLGDVACFSFFPTKNLGAFGDGGMITTNSDALADRIRMLRFHGQKVKYKNELLGYNSRLDEIQAAVLNVKLPYLNQWNGRRRELAERYDNAFADISEVSIPVQTINGKSVYHIYSLMADSRDKLAEALQERGIGTGIYYSIPLHLQEALVGLGHRPGDFPVSEKLSQRALALPMYPALSNEEQALVIDTVLDFYKKG